MFESCHECKHFNMGEDESPCSDCKHNIPKSDIIAYGLADDNFEPIFEPIAVRIDGDPVNHPSHYTQGGIECIQAMEAAFGKEAVATFCHLNAFKYLWRSEHKNGLQDIDKAVWYLNKFKELKSNE